MLLSALPRLTLMLYEISSPQTALTKIGHARAQCSKVSRFWLMQVQPLKIWAEWSIALRTQDYGESLRAMLKTLDDTFRSNPRYLGCAWHSYNDTLLGASQ
jgi:hypothetical protein